MLMCIIIVKMKRGPRKFCWEHHNKMLFDVMKHFLKHMENDRKYTSYVSVAGADDDDVLCWE